MLERLLGGPDIRPVQHSDTEGGSQVA
jgi:hypothetical protein